MRSFGYWLGSMGIEVINNVRWGIVESYDYCCIGIPKHSFIAIGTVGGGPRKLRDCKRFEDGLYKIVKMLKPHTILVYGSAKGECFENLKKQGIVIIGYQSKIAKAFAKRKRHEQGK